MTSSYLIRLDVVSKLMIRCIPISLLICGCSITASIPGIPTGNTTITACWSCDYIVVQIHSITRKFVLREILLEIIGVQINVTVRHFTHTDANCSTKPINFLPRFRG